MNTTTKTVSYLGRCKGCGGRAKITAEVEVKRTVGAYGRAVAIVTVRFPHGETYRGDSSERVFFKCVCGDRRYVEFRRVRGVVTHEPCGARCMSSTGHVCECSCGGKNHGGKWTA